MDDSGNINLLIVVANQNNAGSKLQVKSIAPVDSSQNISEVLKGLSNVQCLNEDNSACGSSSSEVVPNRNVGAGHPIDFQSLGHAVPSPAPNSGQSNRHQLLQSKSHGSFDSMEHSPSMSQNSQGSPGMLHSQSVNHGLQGQHNHSLFQHVRHVESLSHNVAQASPQRSSGRNIIRPPQLVLASQQSVQNQGPHHPVMFSAAGQQCNPSNQAQESSQSIHMNNANSSSFDPRQDHSTNMQFAKSLQQPGTFKMPGFRLSNDNRTATPVGSPQLILQPAPANSTKPVQFILKASESKAGEAPKFILKPAQGSDGLSSQGVASPQFILKAVSPGDLPASPMPPASPQLPISATIASKPATYSGVQQHMSQPMQNVQNMNTVAPGTRSLSQGVQTEGRTENHSNQHPANMSWTTLEQNSVVSSSQLISNAHRKITGQESQALREMVNGDPNLKTLENRFKDHRSDLVMLPERVQEHYLHTQAANRINKNGSSSVPHGLGQTSDHPNTPASVVHIETPVSMTGIDSEKQNPTQSSCNSDLPPRTSPSRVDLTYQHSVNSSHSYCQNDSSEFPTLSEFNAVDQHGNFTSQDRSSLLSDFLPTSANSFQDSATQPDSGHGFSKSVNSTSDLGSLPSPSNIELDFDSFDLMESPLPELGASLLATSSPQSSLGDFTQEDHHQAPSAEQNNSSLPGNNSQQSERQLCEITDFSPDWSYTEVGTFILL